MQVVFPTLFYRPLRSIPYHHSWYLVKLAMEIGDGWHGVLPILFTFFSSGLVLLGVHKKGMVQPVFPTLWDATEFGSVSFPV